MVPFLQMHHYHAVRISGIGIPHFQIQNKWHVLCTDDGQVLTYLPFLCKKRNPSMCEVSLCLPAASLGDFSSRVKGIFLADENKKIKLIFTWIMGEIGAYLNPFFLEIGPLLRYPCSHSEVIREQPLHQLLLLCEFPHDIWLLVCAFVEVGIELREVK